MNQTDEFSQESIDRIKADMMDFLGVENVENDVDSQIISAEKKNDVKTLHKIFIENKLRDIKKKTVPENWSYLHMALLYFKPTAELVKFYLDNGLEVNAQDGYGMTPLHYAMRSKNPDAALVLLEAGADPNIPNIDNIIPLAMIGSTPTRLDVLEKMLQNGGDVHYLNADNEKGIVDTLKENMSHREDFQKIIALMERYA